MTRKASPPAMISRLRINLHSTELSKGALGESPAFREFLPYGRRPTKDRLGANGYPRKSVCYCQTHFCPPRPRTQDDFSSDGNTAFIRFSCSKECSRGLRYVLCVRNIGTAG